MPVACHRYFQEYAGEKSFSCLQQVGIVDTYMHMVNNVM